MECRNSNQSHLFPRLVTRPVPTHIAAVAHAVRCTPVAPPVLPCQTRSVATAVQTGHSLKGNRVLVVNVGPCVLPLKLAMLFPSAPLHTFLSTSLLGQASHNAHVLHCMLPFHAVYAQQNRLLPLLEPFSMLPHHRVLPASLSAHPPQSRLARTH